jgi:glycosyltransferase involved in cell wall biosynthesis
VQFISSIPVHLREHLYFSIAPYQGLDSQLTAKEAMELIVAVKEAFPAFEMRPPFGREVWDSRISPELALDSDVLPEFSFSLGNEPLKFSIIIPSFNSASLLKCVLGHLLNQDVPRSCFEIILVDDGSTDGSRDQVRNFLAPEAGRLNFKYIYFARKKPRVLGDGNFRAGISRNLGVKHSRGELLVFLDSDIIVPRNYLSILEEKHRSWDVVQSVRLHLKKKMRDFHISYESINVEKDTYVLEKKYWGAFFSVKSWQSLPFFWKYTCTYALSLKSAHFKQAGWFKRTFVYYGFEDTDLGYRLAKAGRTFFLNPTVTYHLDAKSDRSEYQRSSYLRQMLLSKTAKVLFLNTLDPAIYQHFILLMGGERSAMGAIRSLLFPKKRIRAGGEAHLPERRLV